MKTKQRIDARCSEWPWVQGATASSDFRFIRNISDDNFETVMGLVDTFAEQFLET